MFDEMVQELKEVSYVPKVKNELYLCWYLVSWSIYKRWYSQDD